MPAKYMPNQILGKEEVIYKGTILAGNVAKVIDFNKVDYDAALKSDKLIVLYSEPDQSDMEMMGVKREEVGYRSIEVMVKIDKITNLPSDWTYNLIFLTKEEDGNPGMAFGDTFYTRDEVKNLTASNKK